RPPAAPRAHGAPPPPPGDPETQTVAQRLAELTGVVDGPLVELMALHARASADGAELMAVSGAFARRGLLLYAADAAAMAALRLRTTKSPLAPEASAHLGDILGRCDTLHTPALRAARPPLTVREREVARLAAAGVASKQIAEQLFLSARTVENHLQRVYRKLGITNRSELSHALQAHAEP
ncbi:helix-turn-helix transcriptional regulator, partial [Micromonospora sp. CPCC 205371]|nr:helix-turn-helix transcriptional regulator [Micromonospora sp. CPCC 205371]